MLKTIRENLNDTEKREKRETLNFYALILVLLFLTVLIIHLNFFVIMNIEVSGSSMESTLYSGDNLISIRGAKIERGDIIIINKIFKICKGVISRYDKSKIYRRTAAC